jgi:dolichol-phosphate mannosyltransferase
VTIPPVQPLPSNTTTTTTTTTTSRLRIARDVEVSIIVPTLNEAVNLVPLLARIEAAMAGRSYEVVIVDDNSRDGTPHLCRRLAQTYPLRLVCRPMPIGGLSGAVLRGMKSARGDVLVLMDADLQHPPEKIPELLAALDGGAEFAMGSRYVDGGSTQRGWGRWRKLNSRFATLLSKAFAGELRDPMSGFFALNASTFRQAGRLNPVGYKIALELLCKCGVKKVAEVPISFGCRQAGTSKLTWRQRTMFLQHLGRLYAFKFPKSALLAKWLVSLTGGAVFGAMTNPTMAPALALWAGATVAYTTRANRPVSSPLSRVADDREADLRAGVDRPTELAA